MNLRNAFLQTNHRVIDIIKRSCIDNQLKGNLGANIDFNKILRLIDGLINEISNLQKENDDFKTRMVTEKYKHFKGGIYDVIMEVTDERDLRQKIIYKDQNGKTWIRDKENFFEKVTTEQGVVSRFEKIK